MLTILARHGAAGAGQPQVGDTAREAVDAGTRAEGQGEDLSEWND